MIGELPSGVPENLIPYLTQTAKGVRDKLKVFGGDYSTKDGTAIRDYIDVTDLAKAHIVSLSRLIQRENKESAEVFNLGTGMGSSVLEVIKAFQKATGILVPYEIVGRRDGDIVKAYACTKKAQELLNWKAVVPLEESLRNAWNWERSLSLKSAS